MTGEQFRQAIGVHEIVIDKVNQYKTVRFQNIEKFNKVKNKLRVLARATAEDKLVLISGIKFKGEDGEKSSGIVGMTGEGISDADALLAADVGLCMGSGCDVAKDSSDLIISDNDFESIYRSMLWG